MSTGYAAITARIYDAATDEVIPIIKRTMNVIDAPGENTYTAHIGRQVVTRDLRIQEAHIQQFMTNQRNVGTDNLPSDPMKYVDSTLLERALAA